VHCAQVEWDFDKDRGRPCPTLIPGSAFSLDADLVLIAMGFVGPSPTQLVENLGIAKDERGFIACSTDRMTNVEGVFVAGDMRRGASLVVHAIADGMHAARQVLQYLNARR